MGKILAPLEYVVSKILIAWHSLFTSLGLPGDGGITWALSIVGLVVVIRILITPLFIRQIKAQRGLQLLQPEIKKLQEKYKNDRERQSKELMELYKRTGTNPFASCLPILLQAPIFFSLFRVLNGVAHEKRVPGFPGDLNLVRDAANAKIFGASISDSFLGADNGAAKTLTVVLIVLMSLTSFLTQRQVMTKNMPPSAAEGQFAQQQKMLLYVFPLVFAVSGVNFPIGVLIYWLTTNLWSMGQQFYVIAFNPTPGSPAAIAREERLRRKHKATPGAGTGSSSGGTPAVGGGATSDGTGSGPNLAKRPPGQRQQPRRQPRAKRDRPPGGAAPGNAEPDPS
ncbi:YidC/Oxa1 family membrane protein insertase [Motilibacter peucedani]|uniref:Membrane protein insertase YidC n=1 Tax=Motilibacter peucedani TaxID=598650 RepID=A0A420XU22_9ACTN|nr:membrane protein insertase YidC [Motilibacter peucedani]RKS80362.1 YidC/Oxa1 family membrane protein insertase [Motilibacter peucedani]